MVVELFEEGDVLWGHYGYFVSVSSRICFPCLGSAKVPVHCKPDTKAHFKS
jgi:hypothetical protein